MIVDFDLTEEQIRLAKLAMENAADSYVNLDISRGEYTLTNSAGNELLLLPDYGKLIYAGSRNAPWAGYTNAVGTVLIKTGIIEVVGPDAIEVADSYRHIIPLCSQRPSEEWWRHTYLQYWSGKSITSYVVEGEPPAQAYDDIPDEEYRAI